MLAGCGQNGSTEEENNDVVSISEIENTANDETLDYINDIEERVHKINFESYDEIISLLEGSEGYAYVNVKGYDGDVLAVATYTYDDMMGHMKSTECTFYTIKRDGTVSADAVLTSSGTATPVSIDDEGIIYTATHRFVNRFCYGMDIPDGVGMICMSQVKAETLDDDGHPTSIWGYYRTSNTVANDDNLVMLEENDIDFYNKIFDEYYDNSQPIYFTLASVSLKDYEGLYYKTEMEELEYYDVTHTTGYQFNSDGTGIYYGQDTVDFTWNESEIHFADNTVHFVMESGKLKVGEITYDKMEGRLINPSVFINSVAEGDVIYLKGELVPVNSIQWEDSKCVDINGGSDNDGIDVL